MPCPPILSRLLAFLFLVLLGSTFPYQLVAQHDCRSSKQGALGAKAARDADPWPWDLLHERITLDLTLGNNIRGACEVTATPRTDGLSELPLQLLALQVDSVILGAQPLSFTQTGFDLAITLPTAFNTTDTLVLTVHYSGDPTLDASGFGGFYTTGQYSYNLGVAFTSVPHSYGRAWFPCVDNFVERCTYEFIITTVSAWNAWCNGHLIAEWQPTPATRTRHWSIEETMPAYLASVAASNYAVVRDTLMSIAGSSVPVTLVARPTDTTAMKNSFTNLQVAFDRFEDWFGPYRWNRVGYVLTPQGAMEHATSIHYPASIADGSLSYQNIMAHELAHHWFGDLITCERAEEMYINEGFAEYLSYLFYEALGGSTTYMNKVRGNHRNMLLKAHIEDEGWWALADMPQEWTYGEHTYNKGADVLHSLRSYMGDSLFSVGLTSLLTTHAYSDVSTAELRDHLELTTGVPLTDFFADWVLQPGWAAFETDSLAVGAMQPDGSYPTTVFVQQKQRGPASPYHNVPVTLSFMGPNGEVWTSPQPVMLGDATCTATAASPFPPRWAYFNADERLSLAQTFDTDSLAGPATRIYPNADLRITVNSTPSSFKLRLEEYWVPSDPQTEEAFAYVVSPDRYWRIIGNIPEEADLSARFTYDGHAAPAIAFDSGLMQDFEGITFREDSLVILYRPDARWPWALHPDQTLNVLGSAVDRSGRIDVNGIRAGEYCLAWRKSAVGVMERASAREWSLQPNPASDQVLLQSPGLTLSGIIAVLDGKGRLALWEPVRGASATLDTRGLTPGAYVVRYTGANGVAEHVGRLMVRH